MTLRVGLVGCGFIAGFHSRAIKAIAAAGLADVAVTATCDLDLGRAKAFARAHGAERVVSAATELFDAVDAVFVCTPTSSHPAAVKAAAEAGLAVFCEKPLATSLADAEAMAAAVEAAGVPAQVGLVLRRAPAYRLLVERVTSGDLGRPLTAVFRDDQYFPVQGQYGSDWRGDVAVAGGGTLLEHSIHDLDVLRWLFGEAEAVTARTANFSGYPGVEDVAVASLTFGAGVTATLTSVWHSVLSRPSTRRLEVFCERGVAWVEGEFAGPVLVASDAGTEELACPPPSWVTELPVDERWRRAVWAYAPQVLDFLTALAEGRPPAPDLGVAVAAHRLADAVYRSAAAGGTVVNP